MQQIQLATIKPLFVDVIPDQLEDGILYVCERYGTVIHKCCCGCGEEVVTPLSPVDWTVHREGKIVSLSPSIGNWSFACKSHYWIWKNQVIWAHGMTYKQVERVKARDKADKEAYISFLNLQKDRQASIWSMLAEVIRKIRS